MSRDWTEHRKKFTKAKTTAVQAARQPKIKLKRGRRRPDDAKLSLPRASPGLKR